MAAHVRALLPLGTVQFRVEQLANPGFFYDFTNLVFTLTPAAATAPLTLLYSFNGATNGVYRYDFATMPPAVWLDGEYAVYYESTTSGPISIAAMTLANGDSSPFSLLNVPKASFNLAGSIGAAIGAGGGGSATQLAANGLDLIPASLGSNGATINIRQAIGNLLAIFDNVDESVPGQSISKDPLSGRVLVTTTRGSSGYTTVQTPNP